MNRFQQIEKLLLTPLAINDTGLIISEVLLEGQSYTNYNPNSRVLNLPAGTGGHFVVTYEPIITNIVSEDFAVIDGFRLWQNYPNPFNPSTKIKFTVPLVIATPLERGKQSQKVTLKVFDILGNEITTLVNEEKLAGEYEVEFSAKGLSSGIYFYTLNAGSYTETKKMILLK